MKLYLISGGATQALKKNLFSKKLIAHGIKKMLLICFHHTAEDEKFLQYMKERDWEGVSTEVDIFSKEKFLSGDVDLLEYDSIYIAGGLANVFMDFYRNSDFGKDLIDWFKRDKGIYFGASMGTILLFEKAHSESEADVIHKSVFLDDLLGFIPAILPEVHYSHLEYSKLLYDRHMYTLKDNPELKTGMIMTSDCILEIDTEDLLKFKILNGSYITTTYYDKI